MDPIADMLTSIRNAQAVSKETVSFSFSKIKFEIAKLFKKEGFIDKVDKKRRGVKRIIEINLKYDEKKPVISGLKKVSKPGQRLYFRAQEIKSVKSGYGVAIVSTSKGLMTNKEARKQKIGGEIICEIW